MPDIIAKNRKFKNCLLIVVAIPSHRNATQKTTKKKLKYENLITEMQQI
jgi:hypothetical protein